MHPLLRSLLIILASALGAAAAMRLTLPSPASRVTKDSAPVEAALESGRGRHARGIGEITAAGWKDVLWRTAGEVSDDRVAAVAGGVVFFALMAIFPAIAALVSLAGLFSDRGAIAGDIAQLVGFLPDGLRTLILDEVDRHVAQDDAALGLTLAVGLGFALWSANAGTKAVIEALNVAYGEREKRGFLYLNLISLTLTFGALGLTLAALWLVVAIPILIDALGSELLRQAIALARWPVIAAVATLAFAVLYRYAPSRRPPQWRWVWLGPLLALHLPLLRFRRHLRAPRRPHRRPAVALGLGHRPADGRGVQCRDGAPDPARHDGGGAPPHGGPRSKGGGHGGGLDGLSVAGTAETNLPPGNRDRDRSSPAARRGRWPFAFFSSLLPGRGRVPP
jgi:uncharacterized BrkB/YihY/UPF0761 family membrane protein